MRKRSKNPFGRECVDIIKIHLIVINKVLTLKEILN